MFDTESIEKLIAMLTDTELAILTVFFQSLGKQPQNEDSSLILEVGWQGVDLISDDLALGIGTSGFGVDHGYQIA